jgi:predicted N-acetyltransferase YhbS
MIVRRATTADSEALAGLIAILGHRADAADLPARIAGVEAAPGLVLVAVDQGEVLGMVSVQRLVLIHRTTPVAFLSTLSVQEKSRRSGIARALVAAVEEQARGWGCETVELTSRNDRQEAHRFWEALGFEARSRKFVRKVGTP